MGFYTVILTEDEVEILENMDCVYSRTGVTHKISSITVVLGIGRSHWKFRIMVFE